MRMVCGQWNNLQIQFSLVWERSELLVTLGKQVRVSFYLISGQPVRLYYPISYILFAYVPSRSQLVWDQRSLPLNFIPLLRLWAPDWQLTVIISLPYSVLTNRLAICGVVHHRGQLVSMSVGRSTQPLVSFCLSQQWFLGHPQLIIPPTQLLGTTSRCGLQHFTICLSNRLFC